MGGRRMKMDWLRALASEVGCRDVRTVLATGNVVMSPPEDAEATGRALEAALAEQYGAVAVVMRTHDEPVDASRRNPWAADVASGALEGRAVHTIFCATAPSEEAVAGLKRDDFAVSGREAYLRLAGLSADTRYTGAWFERHLKVTGTARNHNTVMKLITATGPRDQP